MEKVIRKKSSLRKQMLLKLKNQKEESRLRKSSSIAKKFFALRLVRQAKHIMFYLSMADEVDTFGMIEKSIQQGKQVSVPAIVSSGRKITNHMRPCQIFGIKDHLVVGPLGIAHPKKKKFADPGIIDIVVVPGLAFDQEGNRLGRGGGYYDRFLSDLPTDIYRIGLAFSFQVLGSLPKQPHDITVDKVIAS